jgi:hypothetical protein
VYQTYSPHSDIALSAIDDDDFYSEIRKKNDLISTHGTDSIEDQKSRNDNRYDDNNMNDNKNENGNKKDNQRWVAMVNKIYPTSPAERAGLHVGGE